MSEDSNDARVIQSRKGSGATQQSCALLVFDDGSAHILGETIEWILKGGDDAWLDAMAHLQKLGYRQIDTDRPA